MSSTPPDQQPLVHHLEELRWRLWICVGVVLLVASLSFAWAGHLMAWLKAPAGSALTTLAFFSPAEGFLAHMKVAIAFGMAGSMPIVLWQAWSFIRPAMSAREHRYGLIFVWCGSALFFAGIAFAYTIALPCALRFLLAFGQPALLPVISVDRYLSFTATMLLASGVVFELPLAIFLLTKIGMVTPDQLRRQWRMAYLLIFVAAAILTPTPDMITMLIMAVPMLALYEVSIIVARVAARPSRRS